MKQSRKQREIEARRAADPLAQAVGREDIDYGSDDLPTAPRSVTSPTPDLREDEEPSFTVLGRDQLAQAVVRFWIERAETAGVAESKIARARERYDEIVAWQSDHPERVKVPD